MSQFYDDANRFSDFRQNYLYLRLPSQILMDDDPKKLTAFYPLYGTIINNTDGSEITRIDVLPRRMEYNKFSFFQDVKLTY